MESERHETVLFENKFTPTEGDFREYFNAQTLSKLIIIVWCALGLSFAINLAETFRPGWMSFTWDFDRPFLIIMPTVIVATMIARWSGQKQMRKQANLISMLHLSFYDDGFQMSNLPGTLLPYEKISKVIDSDHFVFIIIDKAVGALVKKDAFVAGDYASFMVFLNQKMNQRQKIMKTYRKKTVRTTWRAAVSVAAVLLVLFLIYLFN